MKNEAASIRRLSELDETACALLNEINRKVEKLTTARDKHKEDESIRGELMAYIEMQEFILFKLK